LGQSENPPPPPRKNLFIGVALTDPFLSIVAYLLSGAEKRYKNVLNVLEVLWDSQKNMIGIEGTLDFKALHIGKNEKVPLTTGLKVGIFERVFHINRFQGSTSKIEKIDKQLFLNTTR
jgi:hypothetical protein